MAEKIANRTELCSHGNIRARTLLLDVTERALGAIHPSRTVPASFEIRNGALVVNVFEYDLDEFDRVFLVGAGKHSLPVVSEAASILGDCVYDGIVVDKRGGIGDVEEREIVDGLEVMEAGHPIPDSDSDRAGRRMLEIARQANDDDLVVVCITGGASALLARPAGEVSLADLAAATDLLLRSGAPIEDVNAVRKHLSMIKGGWLASEIHPATSVSLITVDEVAGDPWGPTIPDETTFADAIDSLERHGLWDEVPGRVASHLRRGLESPEMETPDSESFEEQGITARAVVLADAEDVCEAAVAAATARGVDAAILSTGLEGESREVGTCLGGIVREIAANGRPVEPPCLLVSGGETTVTVTEPSGAGGPNQELALSIAQTIESVPGTAVLSLGTDGTDGPTEIAGGLVDSETATLATKRDVDIDQTLSQHNSSHALCKLGDAVYTNQTGTNVMDLRLIYIGEIE